ncbi:N-acetyllactosaminide beta-1,3-N-acetylglucosaminyltransferase 3 [Sorex araneus]|uniref:N-acetyllactosaminide beta-1,3-N-acetylglucosaminyltransferase 3 n=1 Tax=Sorex araneus TaxID=42254 RepID=UPI00033161D5|nr:N-acetyllactosaminide beta-1,3-N-acetylglucosaminyltransferase 3 [Sorex araneus]
MHYPRLQRTEVILAVALVTVTLLLLYCLHQEPLTCVTGGEMSREDVDLWLPEVGPAPSWGSPPPPCHANMSMAALPNFTKLPAQVQDFLLHRHCRAFPLLQAPAPAKCQPAPFLLLAIKSSPANYERREAVRRTWGRERSVRGATLRRLFLLGTERDPHEARKVDQLLALEARTHGDILQWDFHDTFFNLTLKQVLFLEWQSTQCPLASFQFNGDDDVFAHTDNMVAFLQGHDPDRHLFTGQLIQNVGPIRVPWSKYYVPREVTANEQYPPYCGGGGFLLSRFTADALLRGAGALQLFPIDDVFLGMCLQHEGLLPTSHSGIRTVGVHSPTRSRSSFDPCFYRHLLLVHRFLPYEMLLMWEALHRPLPDCGKKVRID